MRPYQAWDEVRKRMVGGIKRHREVAMVAKDLGLHACKLSKYLTEEFAFWLDFRSNDDECLHDNGRRVENGRGSLNIYLFVAQLNIKNGRFVSAIY